MKLLFLILVLASNVFCLEYFEVESIRYRVLSVDTDPAVSVTQKSSLGGGYVGNVVIPDQVEYDGVTYSVISIDNMAFLLCNEMLSVFTPWSIVEIFGNPFVNMLNFEEIVVSQENEEFISIDGVLFNKDTTKIIKYPQAKQGDHYTIPETVEEIGENAFSACKNLIQVDVPSSVKRIGNYAFASADNIVDLPIGDNVEEIGVGAYVSCKSIENVVIPLSVTEIGNLAFQGCISLLSVEIGDGVQSIGDHAFLMCSNLETVEIGDNLEFLGAQAFLQCTSLVSVSFGNRLKTINSRTFFDCHNLESVTFGDSLVSIEESAFENCYSLEDLVFPNSLQEIGFSAFNNCTSLVSVSFGDGLKILNNVAFQNCYNLTTIDFGNSLEVIGAGAFSRCYSLEELFLPNSLIEIQVSAFQHCTSLVLVDFGQGVNKTGFNSFLDCYNLSTINWGNVDTISSMSFFRCYGLTELEIPNTISHIEYSAFALCTNLVSVVIGDGVRVLKDSFWGSNNLKSFSIGSGVDSIETGVFSPLSSLEAIYVSSENQTFSSQSGVLYNSNKTELIAYPLSKQEEFFEVPATVTNIRAAVFENNNFLQHVFIPENVSNIGQRAFYNCTSLEEITSLATFPPVVLSTTFFGVDKSIPLNVPVESEFLYQMALGWHEFYNLNPVTSICEDLATQNIKSRVFPNPFVNELFIQNSENEPVEIEVFTLSGISVYAGVVLERIRVDTSEFDPGVYIVRFGDGRKEKVVKTN